MGYRIEASGGAYTIGGTWTAGFSQQNATVAAAFKVDPGGGGGAPAVNKLPALGVG
jgi:hypothetical protein